MDAGVDAPGKGDGVERPDATQTPGSVVMTVRIATTAVASGSRGERGRKRRERPQRLIIPEGTEGGDPTTSKSADWTIANVHEPDIASFVAGCIPGASCKRPLPLMSFLSSTTLAGAEKKRRNEEATKQKLRAEEEAQKALRLNPIDGTGESGGDTMVAVGEKAPPRVVITREQTSNILAPPLLREYLKGLDKPPVPKSG